jgi:uncharacterized protein YciW
VTEVDVVDTILEDARTPHVGELRAVKPELAAQMQGYYDAVFLPDDTSTLALSAGERFLIALRTAAHTGSTRVEDWYRGQAESSDVSEMLIAKAGDVSQPWNGDPRTTAIMRHVDLIVTRPVDSNRADIEALADVGVSPQGIVALSQVVGYVSYQVRLVASLRALGAES